MHRIKLTIEQQIGHMKENGILFNIITEGEAIDYLSRNNYYFRIKAYAKNYPKYNSGSNKGKYYNLEFAYLKEMAVVDMLFRGIIFSMTQDIEHYIKMQLINDLALLPNDQEDGYSIIREVFSDEEMELVENKKINKSACSDLVLKYKSDWAIWNLVEILSFSETTRLYSHFYQKYPQYDNIKDYLFCVKYLRNATAHNNCLLNSLRHSYSSAQNVLTQSVFDSLTKTSFVVPKDQVISMATQGEYAVTSRRLKKWMQNHIVNDFIVMVFAYCKVVTSSEVKAHRLGDLCNFFNTRMIKNADYFRDNEALLTAYKITKKYLDYMMANSI